MRWEDSVLALVDDLEQQAAGLAHRARDAEVDELRPGEYAEVTLASRWHASIGAEVHVEVLGGLAVSGRLLRCGSDWAMLDASGREWLVPLPAVRQARGLSARSVAPEAVGVLHRLGIRSVLRRIAAQGGEVQWHATDGARVECQLRRVGQDFAEARVPRGEAVLPLATLAGLVAR